MFTTDILSHHQLKRYNNFISSCKNQFIDAYCENHHIVPRSLGGTDAPDNIVKLTARQHFIAHFMLSKIFLGNSDIKMKHALWNMVNRDNGVRTNSKMYEKLRKQRSLFLSKLFLGKNNPMYGKTMSEEAKEKISKKLKGRKKPVGFGEKISRATKGKNNPMYGKPKTEKQINAIRKAILANNPMKNPEVVEKIKQLKKGTINCYDLIENKYVRVSDKLFYENERYVGTTSKLIPKRKNDAYHN